MKQVCLPALFLLCLFSLQAQNTVLQFASATTTLPPAIKFIGDKYKGIWQSHYSNGNRCDSGLLSDNKPDGIWKSWYPNGQLRMEIECDAKRLAAAMDEMQRLYRPGYQPGPALREMKQIVVNAACPHDKLAYRMLYFSVHPPDIDNTIREVNVRVQSGEHINSFSTDSPPFTECLVHGNYRTWFENGMLKDSGYCNNGIREGVWTEWDEATNMRAVGFYKNGLRWKEWRFYNKEGKLDFVHRYNRQEEITETIVLK